MLRNLLWLVLAAIPYFASAQGAYPRNQKEDREGIMSEAFKAVIDYLRSQGFKRLFITAQKENIGSNRVIQKQGFKFVETVETRQGENKPNIISKNNYILDL